MEPESRLLDIVDELYGAALGEEGWSRPLSALADFCGAENTALVRVDHASQFSSVEAPRADPDVIAAYNESWWAEDPTVRATSTAPVGRITSLADTGRERFHNSRFYHDFWSRSGLGTERLAVNLMLTEAGFASCVLQASARQDELDGESQRRFALLTPHLIRAVAIQSRLQRLALENAVLAGLNRSGRAGLIAVDAALRILFADEPAEALLSRGAGVLCQGGRFRLADPCAQCLLQRALFACLGNYQGLAAARIVPWHRGNEAQPLSIEVVPWSSVIAPVEVAGTQPAAILLIHSPQVDPEAPLSHGSRNTAPTITKSACTRAELFAAITQDIAENLSDSELSLAWLAERHGVTPRRIRDLFYAENTNFTDYLLNARLDRAQAMLSDPALAEVNVATIALDSGFGDISWFHHAFRRRFGMTPADMRRNTRHRTP